MTHCDFLIVGGGIAGASAAATLSRRGRVVVLEREAQAAYHTTGRSAAFLSVNYGNRVIRRLTQASAGFLTAPPDGFSEHPLATVRGILTIARADQQESFARSLDGARSLSDDIVPVAPEEALRLVPVLRADYVAAAYHEPRAMYLDVDLIHRGYLRAMAAHGGRLVTDAEVVGISRAHGTWWRLETSAGRFQAPVLVNAAGAWADAVARLAGVAPVGLVPMRRTVIIFPAPEGVSLAESPLTLDVDEAFYFKPEAGKVLASPADETPSAPCDAQPEEIDIARTVARIERATTMQVRRIDHKWAGLRSFVADRRPVVGMDPDKDGFFWLAGQGGYGIMTSPALARATAALVTGEAWPEDLAALGVGPADLAPHRPGLRAEA